MRRMMLALAGALVANACANQSAPPGGPPDALPPTIVSITPASGSIDIRPREVDIRFDEVISETPRGAQNLGSIVFISPRVGVPRVSWQRNRITIRPRNGFRPNTVYSVEIRPGITDLRSNMLDTAVVIVFSTGGPIPDTKVSGVVFDWPAGRPASQALVEAIAADSTTYQTLADSSGRYTLRYLQPGGYLIRGVVDRNNNRRLESLEPWDSVRVVVTADVQADVYAFQHDSLPMRFQSVTYVDSTAELRIVFDKPFSPSGTIEPANFRLRGSDSAAVAITSVVPAPVRRAADSLARARAADSANAARSDTSAAGRARADSIARQRAADSLRAESRAAEQRRTEALRRGERPPPRDTLPTPKLARPVPFNEVYLVLERPLQQGSTYVLSASGLQSLSGVTGTSPSRTFIVPRRPPRDTTERR